MDCFKHNIKELLSKLAEFIKQFEKVKQDIKEIKLAINQQRMLCEQIHSKVIQLQDSPKEKSATRIMVEKILIAVSVLDLTSGVTEELAREKIVPNTRDCVRFIRDEITRFKINLPDRSNEDTQDYEKYACITTTTTPPPEPNQEMVLNVV